MVLKILKYRIPALLVRTISSAATALALIFLPVNAQTTSAGLERALRAAAWTSALLLLLTCSAQGAITFRASAAGGATSGTGNRTATITPAVGDLFIVYAFVSTNTNDTPTCSDNNSGAYDLIDVGNVVIATVNHRLSVFVRTSLLVNTTSTVVTVATGSNTSGAVHIIAVSGSLRTGSGAVRSFGRQDNQAAGTAAPTLNQAALTENLTIVAQGSADTTTTAPTDWTERQDTNFATPTIALETATRDSGFTGTTITFGAASSTTFASHALELDGSAPPVPSGMGKRIVWM